jgi:hypothetical protein
MDNLKETRSQDDKGSVKWKEIAGKKMELGRKKVKMNYKKESLTG